MNNDKLIDLSLITNEITDEQEHDINTKHIDDIVMMIRYDDDTITTLKADLFTDIKLEYVH